MVDIQKEIKIIDLMISLYCKKNHGQNELCDDCKELLAYSTKRIEFCPRKEEKTFCNTCHIHCYKSDKREEIRNVMKFSGPRMMMYHPIIAVKHLIDSKKGGKS